jgi:hypothetical protein
MAGPEWQTTEVVAWTEHDGPAGAPAVTARWIWRSTAAALAIGFTAIGLTDVLCPEYPISVDPALAVTGAGVAIAGLGLGWAGAPLVTIATAALGLAVGLTDAIHAPLRGGLIAAAFGLAFIAGTWLTLRQLPLIAWDKTLQKGAAATVAPGHSGQAQAPATTHATKERTVPAGRD